MLMQFQLQSCLKEISGGRGVVCAVLQVFLLIQLHFLKQAGIFPVCWITNGHRIVYSSFHQEMGPGWPCALVC